jgi:hypothetical protein
VIESDRLSSNYISAEFASASLGYLGLHARRLPDLAAQLPRPASVRERAIADAVAWGVQNPAAWERVRAPRVFENRIAFASRERMF